MLFDNLKKYLENTSEKSNFKVSIESSGGYITFSNSGQRGGRKFFTLSLLSIKNTLQDVLNNLSVFESNTSYIEQVWRDLSQYYTDDTIKSIATVQTKPLFTTLTKVISWANEKELEDESLIDLDTNSIEQTIQKLDKLIIYFTPETILDKENAFKNWLKRNVDTLAPVSTYPLALKEKIPQYLNKIGENDYQNLFECTDIKYLNTLYERLLKGGDLYKFNIDTQSRAPSASVKKYIEFLKGENNINPFNDNEEKTEIEKIKFSDEAKGNLDFLYKNILFKGVPGTGKSRAINTIIEKHLDIKKKKENILRINIHSASSNSDLMQGIGISSENGNIKYSEKQGLILDIIRRATLHPNQPFVLVLEEIQENSLNELIGDLIYLIEDDKRAKLTADNQEYDSYEELVDKLVDEDNTLDYVEIPYLVNDSTKYKKLIMPNNLFIFCTSNYRDDKKVIEDNLLRRFEVIEIYPKETIVNEYAKDFFSSLNEMILKTMKNNYEMHPDRFMIGHAIWKDVVDNKTFYEAFSKLITEFKDIREIEFDVFKSIVKDISLPADVSIKIENSYYETIKDIQSKIGYEFIN